MQPSNENRQLTLPPGIVLHNDSDVSLLKEGYKFQETDDGRRQGITREIVCAQNPDKIIRTLRELLCTIRSDLVDVMLQHVDSEGETQNYTALDLCANAFDIVLSEYESHILENPFLYLYAVPKSNPHDAIFELNEDKVLRVLHQCGTCSRKLRELGVPFDQNLCVITDLDHAHIADAGETDRNFSALVTALDATQCDS